MNEMFIFIVYVLFLVIIYGLFLKVIFDISKMIIDDYGFWDFESTPILFALWSGYLGGGFCMAALLFEVWR